ncbi:hypothetical protein [Sphaerisporangium aureirubrum]|uniref:Uncharacterized protein n=1 Tax=Sphaerisporangium aureirubrum TaxID=1544736 RepID=A0ABW1NAK0_9ACTN
MHPRPARLRGAPADAPRADQATDTPPAAQTADTTPAAQTADTTPAAQTADTPPADQAADAPRPDHALTGMAPNPVTTRRDESVPSSAAATGQEPRRTAIHVLRDMIEEAGT